MSSTPPVQLPEPDADSAAHSERVAAHIHALIADAGGAISFADYMQAALYAPGLGYYSAGAAKFAAAGDFTTAPELSPLFAAVVARQCAPFLRAAEQPQILEFGAGSGALAAGLLESLAALDALPTHYTIVEVSADLKARQHARVQQLPAAIAARVRWVDRPDALAIDGVVLANEVLDALPVERFRIGGDGEVEQQQVVARGAGFASAWRAAPQALKRAVRALEQALGRSLPAGYQSELGLLTGPWAALAGSALARGLLLFSDYGYGRREYYAEARTDGTLMCHFRHHAHGDPLRLPGIQDITAWVDFSAVAEALASIGLDYLGYCSQAQFLLAGGITELAAGEDTPIDAAQGIKALTLPGEMGERFRFLAFRRDSDIIPSSFAGRDAGWQL